MDAVGIICEYNPFHNGHLFHLEEVKKMFPNHVIVLVMSGAFTQRGEANLISKWDRAQIALHYGVDLVVELPFPFAVSSADIFAKGAISIFKELGVDSIVFGSESNNTLLLTALAHIQLEDSSYQGKVKKYLNNGYNYPTAMSLALKEITGEEISTPNDILGLCYIKEIIKQQANIHAVSIQRTDHYHTSVTAASSIRKRLMEHASIQEFVPKYVLPFYQKNLHFTRDYFPYLKYQIITHIDTLHQFHGMDEGLENRIKKAIFSSSTYEELMEKVKTKRYTYQRLSRLFTYVLCHYTKKEAKEYQEITYIRLLAFSKSGQSYLNQKRKEITLPIVTRYRDHYITMLDLEKRISSIYTMIDHEKSQKEREEYLHPPIHH